MHKELVQLGQQMNLSSEEVQTLVLNLQPTALEILLIWVRKERQRELDRLPNACRLDNVEEAIRISEKVKVFGRVDEIFSEILERYKEGDELQ